MHDRSSLAVISSMDLLAESCGPDENIRSWITDQADAWERPLPLLVWVKQQRYTDKHLSDWCIQALVIQALDFS